MNRAPIILIILVLSLAGCVTQFIPDITEESHAIVVEASLTDRNEAYRVNISQLQPVYSEYISYGLPGYSVSVEDDSGNRYSFTDRHNGLYLSDPAIFQAVAGRKYKLIIEGFGDTFESDFIEMKPVPQIDSVYAGPEYNEFYVPGESVWGYQVYVDTHDPSGECRYFKWTFDETWEFRYPYRYYTIINRICWKSDISTDINILSTTALSESRVARQPVTFITNETDRLKVKYSILVKQHSISEDEFIYLENLRKTAFDAGGLYDAIPGPLLGNIRCTSNPSRTVLGFFSVSSVTEKRIFIENVQSQFPDFYAYCRIDTVRVQDYDPGVFGPGVYILTEWWEPPSPPSYILSVHKECTDCAMIGTAIKPDYWDEPELKKYVYYPSDEDER